jgi:hypothetical protein
MKQNAHTISFQSVAVALVSNISIISFQSVAVALVLNT